MYLWNFIPHCHFLSHVSIFLFHHVSCEDDSGMYTCKIPQYLHETALLFYSKDLPIGLRLRNVGQVSRYTCIYKKNCGLQDLQTCIKA